MSSTMSSTMSPATSPLRRPAAQLTLPDHAAGDHDISVLPRIFEDAINIAIFQRPLPQRKWLGRLRREGTGA